MVSLLCYYLFMRKHTPTKAGLKLLNWLDEQGRTQVQIASFLGISRHTLWKYIYGIRKPKVHTRWEELEDVTEGAVKASDWQAA